MLSQTFLTVGLGLVALVAAIVGFVVTGKKSRLAKELQRQVNETRTELTDTRKRHADELVETHRGHEVAMNGLVTAHAAVVAKHVAAAERMKEEHAFALEQKEQEKLAAIAKVEGRITDFRHRQKALMDEIFGEQEAAATVVAMQPKTVAAPVKAAEPVVVAAKQIEVAAEPLAAKTAEAAAPVLEPVAAKKPVLIPLLSSPAIAAKTKEEAAPVMSAETISGIEKSLDVTGFAGDQSEDFAAQTEEKEEAFMPKTSVPRPSVPAREAPLPWLPSGRPLQA